MPSVLVSFLISSMILGSCSISYASILVRKVDRFPISQDRGEQTVRLRIKRQVTKNFGVSSWFKTIFLLYGLRKSPLERAQCVRDPWRRTCELLPPESFYLLLTVVPMKPHDSWFQKLQPINRLHDSESILERECHDLFVPWLPPCLTLRRVKRSKKS